MFQTKVVENKESVGNGDIHESKIFHTKKA
jgi:hypothetical protein